MYAARNIKMLKDCSRANRTSETSQALLQVDMWAKTFLDMELLGSQEMSAQYMMHLCSLASKK